RPRPRVLFFFSSRRRHTRFSRDWSSDVCSSDLIHNAGSSGCTGFKDGSVTTCTFSLAVQVYCFPFRGLIARTVVPSRVITIRFRSEERRVGKECRSRGARDRQEEDAHKFSAASV